MSLVPRLSQYFKYELAGRTISSISSAILLVLLARLLSPEYYGLLFLSISVLSVIQVFSKLGIARSAARYIAEYKESSPAQIRHIIQKSIYLNILSVLTVSALLLISYENISYHIGNPNLQSFLLVGVVFVFTSASFTYTKYVLQGFDDIYHSSLIRVIERVGRLVITLLLVLLGYGAIGALFGYVLSSFLSSLVGFYILYFRHYTHYSVSEKIEPGLFRRIAEYNISLTGTKLTEKFDKEFDTILIGFFLNPAAVSYYVISKQIVDFLETPAAALGYSVSPTYGSKKATDELETAAQLYETSFNKTLLLYFPAALGLVLIAEELVTFVFGLGYVDAVPVIQIFSIFIILNSITKITDHPLDYLGRAKERAIASGITSICNIVLNIILIPTLGVIGAALATIITYSAYVFIKLVIVFSELPINKKNIMRSVVITIVISIFMAGVVWVVLQYTSGFISILAATVSGLSIWLVFSLLTGAIEWQNIKKIISA